MKGANFWLYYFECFFPLSYRYWKRSRVLGPRTHIYCFSMNLWRSNEYKSNAEKKVVTYQCGKHRSQRSLIIYGVRATGRWIEYWALTWKVIVLLNWTIWTVLIDFLLETYKRVIEGDFTIQTSTNCYELVRREKKIRSISACWYTQYNNIIFQNLIKCSHCCMTLNSLGDRDKVHSRKISHEIEIENRSMARNCSFRIFRWCHTNDSK